MLARTAWTSITDGSAQAGGLDRAAAHGARPVCLDRADHILERAHVDVAHLGKDLRVPLLGSTLSGSRMKWQ